ncbi:MAG: TolC family protein, partial [Cyanobacteria bacterium J06559_1]
MPSASAAERHDGLDDTFFPSGFPPIVLSQSISIPDLVAPADDLSDEITLEQAFKIAEQSNRDIEQAAIAVRQSEAAVREQQAGYQPSVSVSAGGDYSLPISGDNEDSADLDGGIGLSYTLLDFGRREAAVNISSAELQVTELELKVVRQTVRLDIATLYYELQNAIENVRINQAAVANSERNLRDTELREQAGVGTRYD